MKSNTVFLIALIAGVALIVGYAQSRFDICKQKHQKTIECVFEFE